MGLDGGAGGGRVPLPCSGERSGEGLSSGHVGTAQGEATEKVPDFSAKCLELLNL